MQQKKESKSQDYLFYKQIRPWDFFFGNRDTISYSWKIKGTLGITGSSAIAALNFLQHNTIAAQGLEPSTARSSSSGWMDPLQAE